MHNELTEKIFGLAFKVHNELGFGFLESVYEKALSVELASAGIVHQLQAPIKVIYNDIVVGDFAADVFVEEKVILELKSVAQLSAAHEVQLVNYLTATKIDIGLLINFGPSKVDIKRKHREYKKTS